MARHNQQRSQRGFTLAEILVTTAIFAIIMIAALTVYDRSNRVFKSGTESADLQQSTRIGFDKLTTDIRMAGFDYNRGGQPTSLAALPTWQPSVAYATGSQVDALNGFVYTCQTDGTSGASAPAWNTTVGGITNDGGVKWKTSVANQFQQMDEQIEYAGVSAIALRANFDYNTDATHGNGLESAEGYTPLDASGTAIFPYVTTGDDEIVVYALRSADSTKNTGAISFWLDAAKPRSAYPGGHSEQQVTVGTAQGISGGGAGTTAAICSGCGIDVTNANPPYTLYRITVADVKSGSMGTPVAENIRSLNFYYYTDVNGATLLSNTDLSVIASTRNADGSTPTANDAAGKPTGAIGGDGQYDPAKSSTTNGDDRSQRARIASIAVSLTGMASSPEPGYTNPTETIATIKGYHEYSLRSLIVPRNLGLTGFPEPSNSPPGPPTITGICTGHCAVPVVCWSAPVTGGPVSQYIVEWDSNPNGAYTRSITINDPNATTVIVPDDGIMDPSITWYYRVLARNDNGMSPAPAGGYAANPKNATKPNPPTNVAGTNASSPHSVTPANTDYAVVTSWTGPTGNTAPKNTTTCTGSGCSADGTTIPPQEYIQYQVWRDTNPNFVPPGQGVQILTRTSASQPAFAAPGSAITWKDSPATSAYPPGTCVQYYYRVEAVDRCIANGSYNASGSTADSESTLAPATAQAATAGQAYDAGNGVQATAPLTPRVDTAVSICPKAGFTTCTITLDWSPVVTDNAGNAIGVDHYQFTRSRKKHDDGSYQLDVSFGVGGSLRVGGYSANNSGTLTYTDNTAPAFDADGDLWYYQYTIAANDCRLGLASAPVVFPTACTVNPNIQPNGGSGGTGLSPLSPWIFNTGDTITVSPASGTFISVTFDVSTYPGGVEIGGYPHAVSSPGPYVLSWSDQSAGTFQVKVTTVNSAHCTEVDVRYVQQQVAAPCAFDNVATQNTYQSSTSGATTTVKQTYTLTNTGPDDMIIASQPIVVTWQFPAGDTVHGDLTIDALSYRSGTYNFTNTGPGTITRNIPTTEAVVTKSGGTRAISVLWQYKKTDDPPALSGVALTKLCIAYTILSEPGVVKKCNLVGGGAPGTTNNPNSCD